MADIENARRQINDCDRQMAALFEKRMEAAREVADYKCERGLPVEDIARENEVIARGSELVENDLIREYYVNFLHSCMDISKSYQHRLLSGQRVAYSGVSGAFADIVAKKIFPDGRNMPYPDFKAAYDAVVSGECDCALLPIENSFNGDVGQVMDLAFFGSLYINGVYQAEIVQNLLAVRGTTMDEVREVISHPQALGQCAQYIKEHGFGTREAVNTAVAAQTVARSCDHTLGAIGSTEAAEKYGLKILESHINESSKNTTRFAVFSRSRKSASKNDNSFIMLFTVKNEPGSLGKAVSAIGENGFNLRALKSRPTKELSWSYYFYAEGEGCIDSFDGRRMLSQLEPNCMDIKIVGSYEKEISL